MYFYSICLIFHFINFILAMVIYAGGVDYTLRFRNEGSDFLEDTEHFTLKRTNSSLDIIFASGIYI